MRGLWDGEMLHALEATRAEPQPCTAAPRVGTGHPQGDEGRGGAQGEDVGLGSVLAVQSGRSWMGFRAETQRQIQRSGPGGQVTLD